MHDERATPTGTKAVKKSKAGGDMSRLALATRLALAFDPIGWRTESRMPLDACSEWLECTPEEVEMLVKTGLLRTQRHSKWSGPTVAFADLVRFIKETDWLALRARVNLEHLTGERQRLREKAEFEREEVARAKADEEEESAPAAVVAA